jgi:hypothetical protein
VNQPDTAVAQRLLELAREALPDEDVRLAVSGMVRPSPLVLTVAPALIVVVLYVVVGIVLQPGAVASILIVVAGLVLVLVGFMRFAVESVLIAATRREVIAIEFRLGVTGAVRDRQARPLTVVPYWDRRYRLVEVGQVRAFVTNRLYGSVVDELSS